MPDIRWYELGDGAGMPWIQFGPDAGTPVLIVPGLTDGLGPVSEPSVAARIQPPPRAWDQLRVIVVSHRHPIPRRTTTRALAADLADFCDGVLGAAPELIAAHSMGAMITMLLAFERPDLARRLVLSAPVATPDEAFVAHIRGWADLVIAGDWVGFAREACETAYTGAERDQQLAAIDVVGPPAATHLADRHLALTDVALGHDATDVLPNVDAPTLVMGGSDDPVVSPAAVQRVAELLPNAELQWFPGLAHGFPEQGRSAYQQALRTFLAGTPVAARS